MEGYVFEWINFIKGWRPRYLICENQFLFVSHQKSDNKKKQIELSIISKVIDDKKKKFSVDLGNNRIYFKAKTSQEKDLWMEVIKINISNCLLKKASDKNFENLASESLNNKNSNVLTLIKFEDKNIINNDKIEENNSTLKKHNEKQLIEENYDKNANLKINTIHQIKNTKTLNESKLNKNFSKCFCNYQEVIENEFSNSNKNNLDKVIYSFKNLQNLFFEYNNNLEDFNQFISKNNNAKEYIELKNIYNSFYELKSEIKAKFDDSIKNFYDFKNLDTNDKYINQAYLNFSQINNLERRGTEYFETFDFNEINKCCLDTDPIKERKILVLESKAPVKYDYSSPKNLDLGMINENCKPNNNTNDVDFIDLDRVYNVNNEFDEYIDNDSNNNSYQDCYDDKKIEDEEFKSIKSSLEKTMLKESLEKKEILQRSFSFVTSDFYDNYYNFPVRKFLPMPIKCSNSMISDMLKSLTKEKVSLPIHYNEPLSMLQKQCEKFMYSSLLHQAGTIEDPYLKLVYISGFLIADVSTNINRILKPFNPILGETFEFFDNNLKYRYFSEQVSHNPPISAFICESDNFVFFGDTRCKNKFSFFKGHIELNFMNKYNLILKNTNDHYIFNKPDVFMKGLVFGSPHFDFKGIINIDELNKNEASAVIEFFEEGKKSKTSGYFEGKILDKNKEIVYLIKGSCDQNLYYTNKDGTGKTEIWQVAEYEEFIKNTDFINNYLISSYSCNFNNLSNEEQNNSNSEFLIKGVTKQKYDLSKKLPKTDSRFRKDQKLVEVRKLDLATKEKERLEELQRKRHKFFEEKKLKYSPNYFNEVFDEKNNEYIYIFNGEYWDDRKNNNFVKLFDIFENHNSQV